LKNNVVYDNSSDLIRVYADSTSGLTINNNSLYRNAGTNNYGIIGATSYSNWATWLASIYGNSSINTDPLLKNTTGSYSTSTDFQFTDLSPAIDAGTTTSSMTSTTTDYLDNPIYGTPDIGAYEYQPPYTITNDQPQYTGNLRLYADGKYRYTTATTSTATANLSVAPVDGFPTFAASTTRPEYLNIASTTWSTTKSFTASSSYATTTVFTVGDLTPNAYYTLTVDGAVTSNVTCSHCQANGSGIITFTYSGGWSTHTFTLAPDTATPGAFALLSPYQNEATTSLQPLFTWATTTDSGSGLSKYQLYVDDILTVDNIATTSNSTTTAPLSLGTHTWAVWAINNAGNATTSGTSTFSIVAPAVPVTETHRSSGSSVSSQVQNLLAMGNKDAAEALMKQWPNLFPTTPTTESLLAKIAELKALLAAMQGGNEIAAAITPRNDLKLTRSLSLGLTGLDIKQLQQFLNTHGYIVAQSGPGSKGKETTMFGYATKAAVVRFQKANKISPIGVVGPQTRKAIENLSR
ncbi:MAG: peptidoglycan-binding domain-containing protein, partial [Candidatus Vogelbacteria bacterium]|nr:peptidoglycan-binding domain-containing protein [Candidatus Vogelbacteria bacterium]